MTIKNTKATKANNTEALATYRASIDAAFDARINEEKARASDADILANKLKKINSYKANIAHDTVLNTMLVASIDANFVMNKERANAFLDIYKIERVTLLARALAKAESLHYYMRAILLSAKALKEASLEMTRDEIKSACTLDKKCASKDAAKEALIVKTNRFVAPSTVQAQHASSLYALCLFNILKETRNDKGEEIFVLQENAQSEALLAMCA